MDRYWTYFSAALRLPCSGSTSLKERAVDSIGASEEMETEWMVALVTGMIDSLNSLLTGASEMEMVMPVPATSLLSLGAW